jgi:FkbM family methyltransferase
MNELIEVTVAGNLIKYRDGDRVGRALTAKGIYEIVQRIRPGGTFIDIGAHVGYFSLMAAAKVGPDGTIYAVEAGPDNFALLCENVRVNGFENIHPIHCAAWDKEEALYFAENGPLGQVQDGPRKGREPITGQPMDWLFGHLRPDLIKMDIQGAEGKALAGMPETLAGAAAIIVEIWPNGLAQFGSSHSEILEALEAAHFEAIVLGKETPRVADFDFFALAQPEPGRVGRHVEIYGTKAGTA